MGWLLGILFIVFIGWLIRDNVRYIYELLCGISDDINEIKRKLGLEIENRTPEQIGESIKRYIRESVRQGDSDKSIRKSLGFWGFRKYKWYVDWCREELKKESK